MKFRVAQVMDTQRDTNSKPRDIAETPFLVGGEHHPHAACRHLRGHGPQATAKAKPNRCRINPTRIG